MSIGAKVGITGRLTRDPEQKTFNGKTCVQFTVAVSTTKKDGDKYLADYYNVTAWGPIGEFILPRATKGSLVQVYGDLMVQEYEKDGVKRQSLSVRANDVIPLSRVEKKESPNNNDVPMPF